MSAPNSRSRRRWLILPAAAAVLLLAVYFVATSAPFLRSVILPRVGSALNSELTVGDISLSPFSSLTLREIRLTPKGADPLLTAAELRVRYRLTDLLRGKIFVSEMVLESPVVTVVTAPDGTSNLSRVSPSSGTDPKPAASGSSPPPPMDVRNVSVRNGTFRMTGPAGPGAQTVELSGILVTLDSLVPGSPGRLKLGSSYRVAVDATNLLAGVGSGEFQFRIDERLQLREINGAFDLNAAESAGKWRDYARLAMRLSADSTGSEIREVRLAVTDRGEPAGEVRLSGPFDPEKQEARIAYEVKGIGPSALGLAGALMGVDFGTTRISADGRLDLTRGGTLAAWQGRFSADPLSIRTASGVTPVLGFTAEIQMRADLNEKSASVEKADVSLRQGAVPVLVGALDHPMNISWNVAADGTREATYTLAVKALDVASWRSLFGPDLPAGRVDLEARLTSERDGRMLRYSIQGGVNDLVIASGLGSTAGLRISIESAGKVDDFNQVAMDRFALQVQQGAQRLVEVSGQAQANLHNQEFGGQVSGESSLPAMIRSFGIQGVNLTSGTATLAATFAGKNGQTNGSLAVSFAGLTGDLHGVALRDYEAKIDVEGGLESARMLLRRGSLSLRSGAGSPGSMEFSGEFEPALQRGDFRFKGTNLNESNLAPLVGGALQPRRLESVSVEFSGGSHLDLSGQSSLSSEFQMSRLVVRSPSSTGSAAPLALGLKLEGTGRGRVFDLTQFALQLPATPRAKNELRATAHIELATNSLASGTVSIASTGVDLTPMVDLFGEGDPATSGSEPSSGKPSAPPGEPMHFPIGKLAMDSRLDAVFLRDVAISNWVARVEVNQDRVVINPFSMTLNGAPVSASADLNLGVPGYEYAVKGNLASVPVTPLARSFFSGDRMDLSGSVDASMDIKGAGVDGAALRKNLAGTADFAATNLNYRITALKSPLLQMLVRTLSTSLQIPGIAESPIRVMEAHASARQGVGNLASAKVSSDAFLASARGEIRIADVLTNSSLALPVTVSLPRNGVFEELPTFLTVKGTVGVPRSEVDALALARTLTRLPGDAGKLGNLGAEKLGGALDRALGGTSSTNSGAGTALIKSLLGGRPADANAPGSAAGSKETNAVPAPFNPLDLFKKKPAQP